MYMSSQLNSLLANHRNPFGDFILEGVSLFELVDLGCLMNGIKIKATIITRNMIIENKTIEVVRFALPR